MLCKQLLYVTISCYFFYYIWWKLSLLMITLLYGVTNISTDMLYLLWYSSLFSFIYVLSLLIPSLHTHSYHLSTFIISRWIFTSQWYMFVLNSKRLLVFAHLTLVTIDITIMNIQPFTARQLLVETDYYSSSSICLFVS